jgi:hypothetical protein
LRWLDSSARKQDWDAIDQGIAAVTARALNEVSFQSQGLVASRTDEPFQVLLLDNARSGWLDWIGHDKYQGTRFGVAR